jgi:dipeptidyl-peptidase-4
MVLHELAHAYHDRVLGFDHDQVRAAYERAVAAASYESVLRHGGRTDRHYALTNPMEYFAEATEAYFGSNDFYPFVRAELARHDPAAVEVLEAVWRVEGGGDE